VDVWEAVAARRRALADWAGGLTDDQAEAPSWCEGWRVRDVLGHLVHLAEASQLSMARDLATHGGLPVDRALARMARLVGDRPVAELADRLAAAADGRFHVPFTPAVVVVGELLVHGADMGWPGSGGGAADAALDEAAEAAAVLPVYWRVGGLAFHRPRLGGVTLVADDARWWAGNGPEVRGAAVDLVLLLANRRQVLPRLTGPGVARLS